MRAPSLNREARKLVSFLLPEPQCSLPHGVHRCSSDSAVESDSAFPGLVEEILCCCSHKMQSGEITTVLCYQCRWSFTKDYWSIVSLYEDNCYLQNQVINIICIVIDGLHLLKYFKLYKNDKKTTCTPPFTCHIIGQNEKLFLGGISKHAEKMPSNRYCLQIG